MFNFAKECVEIVFGNGYDNQKLLKFVTFLSFSLLLMLVCPLCFYVFITPISLLEICHFATVVCNWFSVACDICNYNSPSCVRQVASHQFGLRNTIYDKYIRLGYTVSSILTVVTATAMQLQGLRSH